MVSGTRYRFLFGGLVAWVLHLAIGFALVYDGCAVGLANLQLWLWIVTGGLALVALIATLVGYRTWRRTRRHASDSGGVHGSSRFIGAVGTWLSGLSLLIILLTAIPIVGLAPCG